MNPYTCAPKRWEAYECTHSAILSCITKRLSCLSASLSNHLSDYFNIVRLALYQPDIPQNAGTLMRLGACLGVGIDLIEPCGFVLDDRRLRRSGMDYLEGVDLVRHTSWNAFQAVRRADGQSPGGAVQGGAGCTPRLLLLTTRAAVCYTEFAFQPDDILLLGRESAGVPEDVHQAADARLVIPLRPGQRSLNVAVAAAMVVGEALRQLDAWPR